MLEWGAGVERTWTNRNYGLDTKNIPTVTRKNKIKEIILMKDYHFHCCQGNQDNVTSKTVTHCCIYFKQLMTMKPKNAQANGV